MKNKLKKFLLCLLCSSVVLSLAACGNTAEKNNTDENGKQNKEMKFTFENDAEGWEGGFADLPVDYKESGYDVEFKYSDIPVEGKEDKGLFLTGNNHSDDLFMYTFKKVNGDYGLKSNTTYTMNLTFDLATNVPGGMMGIGGSPGQSNYVKAGITNIAPNPEVVADYYRMNIDIGSQSNGGKDMIVLGNIEKEDESGDDTFQYKHFEHTFEVTTNENGEAFVLIGVDSGFEGISELYFTNIEISIE